MPILAPVVCDSVNPQGSRLHTQRWTAPKFIHQESLRHRQIYFMDFLRAEFDADFSFSVSSSRAIPFQRLLAEVRSDEHRAVPAFWGAEQKGMSPGEELDHYDRDEPYLKLSPYKIAQLEWKNAALQAAACAERLSNIGVHKSICNRVIEPYVHVHCLSTATTNGWMNFFGLRLDKAADPTLRALAEAAWIGWNESEPKKLKPGQWHLPFVDDETSDLVTGWCIDEHAQTGKVGDPHLLSVKISVARSAHLSYESFSNPGARMTVEECVALHDRFVNSVPMHASPLEHQATPDSRITIPIIHIESGQPVVTGHENRGWEHQTQGRNLGPGWRQYRALLPNEAVAPLPEGYR